MTIEAAILYKTRENAARPPQSELPPDHPVRRRKPLGPRPVPDDAAHEARPVASEASLGEYQNPVIGLVAESSELLLGVLEDQRRHFESKIAKLEAKLAEATAKVNELAFVSERLRVENRGPQGLPGPTGRDGRDGPRGERGERGAEGKPGKAAPPITGWAIDADNFTAAPILSDGSNAATLRLRPFFEAYDDQVDAGEAAAEIDAARASREATEREAEASRWAK